MDMEINRSEYKILIVDDVMSNVLLLKVLLTNEKFILLRPQMVSGIRASKERKSGFNTTGRYDAGYERI